MLAVRPYASATGNCFLRSVNGSAFDLLMRTIRGSKRVAPQL